MLLLCANAVSGFAQGISMLAIPWYFTKVLNLSSTFGILYAITTFATLFWGLYAGTLIDRFPRKNIFLSLNITGFCILTTVALTGYSMGEVPVFMIGLVFCATIFNYNIHYPTLYALGQEITEKENFGKTNSLIEVMGQSTSVLSGAFAALLLTGVNHKLFQKIGLNFNFEIAPWKLHEIFLLDAFTYALAFTLIFFIKYTHVRQVKIDTGTIKERFMQGLTFLKNHKVIFYFGTASFAIFIILLIHVHQLMPIYVTKYLNADSAVYAGAEMTYSIGALLAGLGIRWIFSKTNSIKAIIILMILSIILFEFLAITKSTWVLVAVCFMLGITNAGTRILRITYIFNHVPNHIIGRTGSVFQSINIFLRFIFISIFALPFFSIDNNIIYTYTIGSIFIFLSLIPILLYYKQLVNFKTNN